MNDFWYRIAIFGLLVMFVLAPFAGFAPLLLVLLVAGTYWFFAPIVQSFMRKPDLVSERPDKEG